MGYSDEIVGTTPERGNRITELRKNAETSLYISYLMAICTGAAFSGTVVSFIEYARNPNLFCLIGGFLSSIATGIMVLSTVSTFHEHARSDRNADSLQNKEDKSI